MRRKRLAATWNDGRRGWSHGVCVVAVEGMGVAFSTCTATREIEGYVAQRASTAGNTSTRQELGECGRRRRGRRRSGSKELRDGGLLPIFEEARSKSSTFFSRIIAAISWLPNVASSECSHRNDNVSRTPRTAIIKLCTLTSVYLGCRGLPVCLLARSSRTMVCMYFA
jgi:hypothetical protein